MILYPVTPAFLSVQNPFFIIHKHTTEPLHLSLTPKPGDLKLQLGKVGGQDQAKEEWVLLSQCSLEPNTNNGELFLDWDMVAMPIIASHQLHLLESLPRQVWDFPTYKLTPSSQQQLGETRVGCMTQHGSDSHLKFWNWDTERPR